MPVIFIRTYDSLTAFDLTKHLFLYNSEDKELELHLNEEEFVTLGTPDFEYVTEETAVSSVLDPIEGEIKRALSSGAVYFMDLRCCFINNALDID